ncbi:MAG: hypothetical protein GY744_18090 [Gammaproteobacteria bacterium]|nr:hypothetical protein [Gammaproteobacteria bacterium]
MADNISDKNVFEKILEPVISIIEKTQNDIPNDSETYKLSFLPFNINTFLRLFANQLI